MEDLKGGTRLAMSGSPRQPPCCRDRKRSSIPAISKKQEKLCHAKNLGTLQDSLVSLFESPGRLCLEGARLLASGPSGTAADSVRFGFCSSGTGPFLENLPTWKGFNHLIHKGTLGLRRHEPVIDIEGHAVILINSRPLSKLDLQDLLGMLVTDGSDTT
jgi:hypothetical protein